MINLNLELFILLLILLFAGYWFIQTYILVVTIQGESMHPTLLSGDQVIAVRHWPFKWLSRGQIAIFQLPDVLLGSIDKQDTNDDALIKSKDSDIRGVLIIKRVIGLPGDRIITDLLDVQENLRDELVMKHDQYGKRVWIIPHGCCFVKGDSHGLYSTILGPIPNRFLIGAVMGKINKPKL